MYIDTDDYEGMEMDIFMDNYWYNIECPFSEEERIKRFKEDFDKFMDET